MIKTPSVDAGQLAARSAFAEEWIVRRINSATVRPVLQNPAVAHSTAVVTEYVEGRP